SLASADVDLLIVVPNGSDRREYAEFVHRQSERVNAALVSVNCAAIYDQSLEDVLFGYVSADSLELSPRTEDLVGAVEGGTLFLDQVQALSPPFQMQLLRFIQEKEYRRLGETQLRHANIRFIAATNADLPAAVRADRFRGDFVLHLRMISI